ncbi:hypothetical protein [Pontibacter ruber]|uniref:Uncharacterized protein n=1 Tax=Pontibacter ruber TaxID=1343895 RepID=A0ABW5D0R9_9BACT|nr:hypothetical protein [Pontibacter ruber]
MQDQPIRDKQSIQQLYNAILPALAQHVHQNLAAVIPLFDNFNLERMVDTWTKDPAADSAVEISIENGNVQQLGLRIRLEGFQKAGAETFDITKDLVFKLDRSSYTVGPGKGDSWPEKEYFSRWDKAEYETLAERWSEELIDDITQRLENLAS